MRKPLKYGGWISRMRWRGASGAVALVVGLGLVVVETSSAQAPTFNVLYTFMGSSDGGEPYAGLVRDKAGNLYGTAISSGAFGWGVVFKVDTSGAETVLHSFGGVTADGRTPYAGLVRDKAGNLYGTTYEGGGIGCVDGCGTVFKVDTTGTETVLHSFAGGTADGCYPYGGLFRDSAGNLYGTTQSCGAFNFGMVFRLSKSGTLKVLHNFAGGTADGANPLYGSLLMDNKGALYGVAQYGGTSNDGVVYKLSKSGALRVLHSFAGGTTDGCNPDGTPAMDTLGNLYGTAVACGSSNMGVVWKVSKGGAEKVLHSFAGGTTDGAVPIAGVVLDAKGKLYGDTQNGGGTGCFGSGCGTVYKVSKTGTLTLLHTFAGPEGAMPFGGVIRDTKGNLYGTAFLGGSLDWGTVWEITK
jgi:uncharacterized repeat protein (TIGR03803 family)